MQIRNLCKFEPAGQTAYCIGFLAMVPGTETIWETAPVGNIFILVELISSKLRGFCFLTHIGLENFV